MEIINSQKGRFCIFYLPTPALPFVYGLDTACAVEWMPFAMRAPGPAHSLEAAIITGVPKFLLRNCWDKDGVPMPVVQVYGTLCFHEVPERLIPEWYRKMQEKA